LAKYGLLDIIDRSGDEAEVLRREGKMNGILKDEEDSLVTGIDQIFQEYHIFRAQYHGGDLAGGHLSQLMNNAQEIMTKVEDYLLHAFSTSIVPHQVDCCRLANNNDTLPYIIIFVRAIAGGMFIFFWFSWCLGC
jgi:hypothetical protein